MAAAYQLNGDTAATLDTLERVEELRFDVQVDLFQRSESGAEVRGTIRNLKEEETTVPALTFEFLDMNGTVVVQETFSGATLTSTGSASFRFNPVGAGVASWRYKVEG